MRIDALQAREEGRKPVRTEEYRGWKIEVYRVGKSHEFQAIAWNMTFSSAKLQSERVAGAYAMRSSIAAARKLIDSYGPLLDQ